MGLLKACWERLLKMCPHCRSEQVRRSRRRSFVERVASWSGLYPHKCAACDHRFFLLAR